MNEPIVQRDDFWGDFVNGLFFRPVSRSVKPASRQIAVPARNGDSEPEEKSVPQDRQADSEIASILITERIPNVEDRDIDVRVINGALTIEAQAEVQTGGPRHLVFSRRIPLPPEVDSHAVGTSYENGVLTVRIPLPPSAASTTPAKASGSRQNPDFGILQVVSLPALGERTTEGTVTRWLKRVGDWVEVDEPLLEVSTDKVDTEIPSPSAGVIEEILVAEDETVEVGAPLVRISVGAGPAETATPTAESTDNDNRVPLRREGSGEGTTTREPGHRLPPLLAANMWVLDGLYERYEYDKNTVDAKWWPLFELIDAGDISSTGSATASPEEVVRDTSEETDNTSD